MFLRPADNHLSPVSNADSKYKGKQPLCSSPVHQYNIPTVPEVSMLLELPPFLLLPLAVGFFFFPIMVTYFPFLQF